MLANVMTSLCFVDSDELHSKLFMGQSYSLNLVECGPSQVQGVRVQIVGLQDWPLVWQLWPLRHLEPGKLHGED